MASQLPPLISRPFKSHRRAKLYHRRQRNVVLKLLGNMAQVSNSHFALLWITQDGAVETLTSQALSMLSDDLFSFNAIERAKERVARFQEEHNDNSSGVAQSTADVYGPRSIVALEDAIDDEIDFEADSEDDMDETHMSQQLNIPQQPTAAPTRPNDSGPAQLFVLQQPTPTRPANTAASIALASPLVDPTTATEAASSSSSLSSESPDTASPSLVATAVGPDGRVLVRHSFTPSTLASWYEERFNQLPQKTSKIILRTIIRELEPMKVNHWPYTGGQDSKPPWWPDGVRHKEPDHLLKQERITLLDTLLRRMNVSPERFETFEDAVTRVSIMLPPRLLSVIDNIFTVVKEERRIARETGRPMESLVIDLHPPPAVTARARSGKEDMNIQDLFDSDDIPRQRSRRRTAMSISSPAGDTSLSARSSAQPYTLPKSNSVTDLQDESSRRGAGRALARSQSMTGHMSKRDRAPESIGKARSGRQSLGGSPAATFQDAPTPRRSIPLPLMKLPSAGGDAERSDAGSPNHDGRIDPAPRREAAKYVPSPVLPAQSLPSPAIESTFASPSMIRSSSRMALSPMGSIAEDSSQLQQRTAHRQLSTLTRGLSGPAPNQPALHQAVHKTYSPTIQHRQPRQQQVRINSPRYSSESAIYPDTDMQGPPQQQYYVEQQPIPRVDHHHSAPSRPAPGMYKPPQAPSQQQSSPELSPYQPYQTASYTPASFSPQVDTTHSPDRYSAPSYTTAASSISYAPPFESNCEPAQYQVPYSESFYYTPDSLTGSTPLQGRGQGLGSSASSGGFSEPVLSPNPYVPPPMSLSQLGNYSFGDYQPQALQQQQQQGHQQQSHLLGGQLHERYTRGTSDGGLGFMSDDLHHG